MCPSPTSKPAKDAVAFIGEAADGSADPSTGTLLSPATFRVEEWTAGARSDAEIRVETATTIEDGLVQSISTGITPRAGERWSITGRVRDDGIVETSVCAGSERLTRDDPVAVPAPDAGPPDDAAPTPGPPDPGEDRALSLAVAAAGATALALSLSRRLSE